MNSTKSFSILFLVLSLLVISVPQTIARSPLTYSPPSQVNVWMYWLTPSGARREPYTLCTSGSTRWGCTAFCDELSYPCERSQTLSYPYAANPTTISIETDYLLDVVPQELPTYYHPTAVQAQAIAARSYAYWHINRGSTINNSTQFQAFIPYKFESLYPATFPDNQSDPCASRNLNTAQSIVCGAVAPRHYVSYGSYLNDDLPAFTEFFADAWGHTVSGDKPYLLGVEDPISTGCDANDFGHRRGMSQEGASRWARGNQCSYAGTGDIPWSVRWEHAEQILTHYYTGVHIRDTNSTRLTPDWRWVPLAVAWSENCPPVMYAGQRCTATFEIQNTGTATWPSTEQVYLWYHGWESAAGTVQAQNVEGLTGAVAPGGTATQVVTFTAPDPPHPGTAYWLRFDLFLEDHGWASKLEPGRPWPTYDVGVCVGGPCRTFIPLVLKERN